jgi:hypothetical protein
MQKRIVGKQKKLTPSPMAEVYPQSIEYSKGVAYDKD